MIQNTLRGPVKFRGVGLHSGRITQLIVHPSAAGTGIVFIRSDLGGRRIPAKVSNVSNTTLSTTLANDGASVSTVEHLLAGLYCAGIDNAEIELDGPEVPILDGSAAIFLSGFYDAGIVSLGSRRRCLAVRRPFEISRGNQYIRWSPASRSRILCDISFGRSRAIGDQSVEVELNERSLNKICQARTFCHIDDVDAMQSQGLAKGGSLENAIVVSNDDIVNAEGLRFECEFAYHKLLDCIGDLSLLGGFLTGQLEVSRGGHALHIEFARAVLAAGDGILYEVGAQQRSTSGGEGSIEGLGLVAVPVLS